MTAEENEAKKWVLDDVDPKTREEVEFWAEFNGTTVAEALRNLVEAGIIYRSQNSSYNLEKAPAPAVGYIFRRGPLAVQIMRTAESLEAEAAGEAWEARLPPDEGCVQLVPKDELPLGVIQKADGQLMVQYQPGMTLDDMARLETELKEWKRQWDAKQRREQHEAAEPGG